ncbi:MAG: protein kinase [Ignavibacteriales bacterium]|nr:protein kinase [Ignavibacteriales bacterium]
MIGQTISHYKILEKLGEGGMGVVYKAQDLKLDRFVALKFLPHHVTVHETEQARFLQEAKAAAALNHPNICTVYGIEEHDDQMFIIMEYLHGQTLRRLMSSAILDPRQPPQNLEGRLAKSAVDYAMQMAAALQEAHSKGIVHRDLKPDNIMVNDKNQIKVMDFGLAKLKGGLGLTKAGAAVGTIAYMSPEQIQGLEVDHRTDLWAFGVILYEMLTGEPPFRAEHEAAIMYEILNLDPKGVQTVRPDAPEHLQVLISQLLQKDLAKRISSAAEIIQQLKKPAPAASSIKREKSIAVLYFENMSSEKESDYFCAGMTEDIITDLSRIRDLKVVSRTDVLPFRNKDVNTRQVGEALRVNYMLEGSVRKAGNKMRITAQLIDVRSGFHLWAERFDRLIEDIFDVQTEVSQKIAEALKVSLTESEKQSLAKKPTDDLRAYDFYMRGREFLYRRGKKNNEAAIQMFENALSLDPNYAAAYAALAEAYSYMYSWYDGDKKWLGKTIEVSQKALSLDTNSIEAQFGNGTVYFHQKRFGEAKRAWEKVIQQNPDFYDAYRWLGIASDITGEYDAALRYYEQCARIKPYSEEPWMHFYMTHLRKGDQKASDQAQKKLLEVGERKLEVNPNDAITLSRMASPYANFGEREKAYSALKRVLDIDRTDGLAQYNCACTYAVLGDKKEALTCLRNAVESGYRNVSEWVKSDPDLVSLHEDAEFKALVAEIG